MTGKITQDIIDLYDAFTHGAMGRREFLAKLGRLAGGAAAASALLPLLANDYAKAAIVAEDDSRLEIFPAKFETGVADVFAPDETGALPPVDPATPAGLINAYGARPKNKSVAPAVIVIHENRGLNAHIKDVARRVALEGFHAFAVDMLSPFGGTPSDEDKAREQIGKLNRETTAAKLAKVVENLSLLKTHQRKVGAVGFCWGGGMVNALAAASSDLDAGVAYYGRQASAEEARKIKAALILHYAGVDERINAGIADYETALKAAGVDYKVYMYEGAQHAFNNDTNEARYNKEAATLAWKRTIKFFKKKLKG
jgi:carboxymethylenebutenolidase